MKMVYAYQSGYEPAGQLHNDGSLSESPAADGKVRSIHCLLSGLGMRCFPCNNGSEH